LLPRPDIVVADEPTAGLDASVKSDVLRVLKEAIAEDTAFLLISHELDVVRWMSDRVMVMHQGQIVQRMPAAQLDPKLPDVDLHPYTAQLLASGLDGAPRSEPSGRLESRGLET
jgi:ABC-type dipeptide/oligopeptide/nickel transport system ATPase component